MVVRLASLVVLSGCGSLPIEQLNELDFSGEPVEVSLFIDGPETSASVFASVEPHGPDDVEHQPILVVDGVDMPLAPRRTPGFLFPTSDGFEQEVSLSEDVALAFVVHDVRWSTPLDWPAPAQWLNQTPTHAVGAALEMVLAPTDVDRIVAVVGECVPLTQHLLTADAQGIRIPASAFELRDDPCGIELVIDEPRVMELEGDIEGSVEMRRETEFTLQITD